jgi:hypothetical protein
MSSEKLDHQRPLGGAIWLLFFFLLVYYLELLLPLFDRGLVVADFILFSNHFTLVFGKAVHVHKVILCLRGCAPAHLHVIIGLLADLVLVHVHIINL